MQKNSSIQYELLLRTAQIDPQRKHRCSAYQCSFLIRMPMLTDFFQIITYINEFCYPKGQQVAFSYRELKGRVPPRKPSIGRAFFLSRHRMLLRVKRQKSYRPRGGYAHLGLGAPQHCSWSGRHRHPSPFKVVVTISEQAYCHLRFGRFAPAGNVSIQPVDKVAIGRAKAVPMATIVW